MTDKKEEELERRIEALEALVKKQGEALVSALNELGRHAEGDALAKPFLARNMANVILQALRDHEAESGRIKTGWPQQRGARR